MSKKEKEEDVIAPLTPLLPTIPTEHQSTVLQRNAAWTIPIATDPEELPAGVLPEIGKTYDLRMKHLETVVNKNCKPGAFWNSETMSREAEEWLNGPVFYWG